MNTSDSAEPIFPRIFTVRETAVMLDSDLAQLYGVSTTVFNQAIKRNLHRFPVDELKIDHLFVSRMGADDESSEIVTTIIQLAHNLGMKVTAEGVETAEQLDQLRALSCEYGQGYYFSPAVDAESAKQMIAAASTVVIDLSHA